MAGPELTSTLTIIDKSTAVLETIANAAEATSKQIDSLIAKMENIGVGFDSALKGCAEFSKNIESLGDSFDSVSDAALEMFDKVTAVCDESFEINVTENFSSVEKSVDSVRDGLNGVIEQLGNVNIKAEKSSSIFDKLKGIFDKGASIAGWIGIASSALNQFQSSMAAVDANTNLISRLGMIARSEGIAMEDTDKWKSRAEEIRKMLSAHAVDLGVDVSEYSANAITFANNPAFSGIEEAARFSELMSKQFFTSGVGGQAQMSVINQLTQGLAKGKLQGEDLMSILSNAPDVGALLEKAYARINNINFDDVDGKVRELATDGKLTADVIKNAFFGAADEIEKNFEEMPNTFEDMITKFKNQAFETMQPIIQGLSDFGNSDAFKNMLSQVNKLISSVMSVVDVLSPVLSFVVDAAMKIVEAVSFIVELLTIPFSSFKKTKPANVDDVASNQRNKIINELDKQTIEIQKTSQAIESLGEIQQQFIDRQKDLFSYSDAYNNKTEEYLKNYQQTKVEEAIKKHLVDNPNLDNFTIEMFREGYSEMIQQGGIFNRKQYDESLKQYNDSTLTLKQFNGAVESNERSLEFLRKSMDNAIKSGQFGEIAGIMEQQRKFKENTSGLISVINQIENDRGILKGNIDLYSERMNEWLKSTAENTKEISKNTKSVSIDRDSILFMKSMTTAEIINRYNNISDSISINNHYNSMPSKQRAAWNMQAELQGAKNALRRC